jgi:hypothetical protein
VRTKPKIVNIPDPKPYIFMTENFNKIRPDSLLKDQQSGTHFNPVMHLLDIQVTE